MSDIDIRTKGRAGRITLTRPKALNAMSYEMCLAIEDAFDRWRNDDDVALIVIDAEGEKAFCAGGDIAELYETGRQGDFVYGRTFWADEYRLNAKIFDYPKPVVSFMQGFTMGGGVGIGCHGSHRVVGDSSRIAMPECGIGLVPDVGGSLILSRAPGRLGDYIGTTAARMGPGDAIHAGFADIYAPEAEWPALIAALERTGRTDALPPRGGQTPDAPLRALQDRIDRHFSQDGLAQVIASLKADDSDVARETLIALSRNSPLSMACAIEMIRRLRDADATIGQALELEYRFTFRAMEQGDFLEGIRAAIIDKDRNPQWLHAGTDVPADAVAAMLQPLGPDALNLEKRT